MSDKNAELLKMHKSTMICSNCNGTGRGPGVMVRLSLIKRSTNHWPVTCDVCNGYGRIKRMQK